MNSLSILHPLTYAEIHVGLHVKCPLLLFDFNQDWKFRENDQYMRDFSSHGSEYYKTDLKM